MKINKLAIITLALSITIPLINTQSASAFVPADEMRDLSTNHWAYKAIEALTEKYGVMSGFPDKTFRGSKNMTRYELAAALYKVMTKVEELIATANKGGTVISTSNNNGVSKEDLETINLLQKEFRDEISILRGKVASLEAKVDKFNKVKIGGTVELKYRDRVAVTDSTKLNSPLNGFDVDGDRGITRFNDSVRNLLTEFDRTPFRVKTSLDVNASWSPYIRFYGTFVADDGTIYKLGNQPGLAVGGHFGDEGLSGTSLYTQRSILSIRSNFENEFYNNAEKDNLDMKPLSAVGTSFYHENKPGYGIALGFMNFQNILRPGTKFKNHFNSEKWIGHGYGLVGFGSDDILVKDIEVKNNKGEIERVRNSVSRFWASGINVSQVDPDSLRYNNIASASAAFDITAGPLTFVVGGNAGSPYGNRVAALTNNLGAGSLATVDQPLGANNGAVTPNTQANGLSTTASPTGILSGADFKNDPQGSVVNEKVIIGSKDPISNRNPYNLLPLPSEYGDGYGVMGLDLDLGIMRIGLNASDHWLDSVLSLSGTRKNISGVIDIGNDSLGLSVQANYNAIGLDTYSAGLFMNNLGGGILDLGFGLKSATRGMFNFGQIAATSLGFYAVIPQQSELFPKLMLAARQNFGDGFGSPKAISGGELLRVSALKDSGITLSASLAKIPGTGIGVDVEYNGLIEGSLVNFNFMAHDFAVFSTYKF